MGEPSFNPYEGHHMLHAFKGLLMPTAVSKLLEEDRNALDPVEAVQLRRVFDHFLPGRKRVQDSSAPPEDGNSKRRRGRPSNDPNQRAGSWPIINDSWGAIQRLPFETLELHGVLSEQLRSNVARDPFRFFEGLTNDYRPDNQASADTLAEALIRSIFQADHLERSNVIDRVVYLFRLLVIGDIFDTIREKKKRHSSQDKREQEKKGRNTRKRDKFDYMDQGVFASRLRDIHHQELNMPVSQRRCQDLIVRYYKKSKNLLKFCKVWGPGSILYLEGIFNEHFLLNKMTWEGEAFTKAVERLTGTNLLQEAERSGANELGNAIRKHFWDVYKTDQLELG